MELKVIEIDSWPKFQEATENMILWGFRGQADSSWDLETTFHRLAARNKIHQPMYWHKEYFMLRQFTRRARHYCEHIPPQTDLFEWLSLMQHHGCPTRLLDFSHSMYIASFFALENAEKDSAIWAINLEKLRRESMERYGLNSHKTNIDHFNIEMIAVANSLISANGKEQPDVYDGVFHVEPERLHERILNQQGLFIFSANIGKSVFENLGLEPGSHHAVNSKVANIDTNNDAMVKFIIPISLRKTILKNLDSMNVNARTLFPGLDGFARSMQTLMLGP